MHRNARRRYDDLIIRRLASVLFLTLVIAIAGTTQSLAAQAGNPAEFIQKLADEAIAVLRKDNGSLKEREAKFRKLLGNDFAMENIGRFVVGSYWRQMSPQQQREYQELFSEWVLQTYSARLGGYSGESVQILKTVPATKEDVFVQTRIEKSGGGAPISVQWRVRPMGGGFKIIDVVVEGVSMAVTQRSEFNTVLNRQGIDGLLGTLRDRIARLKN